MRNTIKILYVEDESINRFIFERLMGKKYHVITASDGPEGLDVLGKHQDINYIVSDMQMPEMNGIEFIKKVKQKYEHKKCFILTGYTVNEEIENALSQRLILEYWTKPANFDTIDNALQQYT